MTIFRNETGRTTSHERIKELQQAVRLRTYRGNNFRLIEALVRSGQLRPDSAF
jgi:hypothetical protein